MQKEQIYIYDYNNINQIINLDKYENILVVCSKSLLNSFIIEYLKNSSSNIHLFTEFNPNPKYEEVLKGLKLLKENNCKLIIAIGGGSAIDVAKTIKAFSNLNEEDNYLNQQILENDIKLLAVPTTAGTGSESTKFAVIYYNENKYSVDHISILPDYVLLESKFLESLPIYQKKSTMMDALCQGIESYWSVNSTEESKKYAGIAIKLILDNYKEYIKENKAVYDDILKAANYSGRAINISKTTAAHAMSYKITSLYGISHGHAVALTLPHIWEYMINNIDKCIDIRGQAYLKNVFLELNKIFDTKNSLDSIKKFIEICDNIDLKMLGFIKDEDVKILTDSVNENRLKNNPVYLDKTEIEKIYSKLLKSNLCIKGVKNEKVY